MAQPHSPQGNRRANRNQATYSRANARLRAMRARDKQRKRNRVIAIVAALLVVAVGVFAGKAILDNALPAASVANSSSAYEASSDEGQESSERSGETNGSSQKAQSWADGLKSAEESDSTEDSDSMELESASSASPASAAQSSVDPANDARAEEFAVDPDRADDWNYEGNGRKVVYLTFDDGPSDKTQAVLDVLDKYGCKATFFVTAGQPEYAYMIKEAYDRGHTIGMHTASHDYAYVYSSVDAYYADLNEIAAIVEGQIGYVPCFIRFPGGSSNAVSADYTEGIMSYLTVDVVENGYQYYDWNASSGDGSVHTADEIVEYACSYDQYDNIILLMHDSTTKETTLEALPQVIEYYQGLGYSFEAIDRDSVVIHHGVSN